MSHLYQKYIILVLFCFGVIFTGCAKQPKSENFFFSTQKKLQATHHWEILVKDLASEMKKSKQLKFALGHEVSIVPNDNSSFTRAFRSCLTTYLVNSGVQVNDKYDGTKINWSLQLVEHKTNRGPDPYPGSFLMASALGYGVYKVWESSSRVTPGLIASAVALDIAAQAVNLDTTKVPGSEIIINFSVLDKQNILLYRKSDIYYINGLDKSHYCFSADLPYKKAVTKKYMVSE